MPEKYFTDRAIGRDLEVPILQPATVAGEDASLTAKVFVTWLKECFIEFICKFFRLIFEPKKKSIFEAINLDYLKAVVIGFYREKGNPDTLFESYKFSINPVNTSLNIDSTNGHGTYKSKNAKEMVILMISIKP